MSVSNPYQTDFTRGRAGQLSSGPHVCHPFTNGSGQSLTAGVLVAQKASTEGSADLFNEASDQILGVTVYALTFDPTDVTNDAIYADKATMDVMTEGRVYVQVEEAVAITDPVYARFTSDGGSNTVLGKFRKSSDSGRAMLLKSAHWVKGASSGGIAELYFSMTDQRAAGDCVEVVIDHASVNADTTSRELKTRSDRFFKVEKVQYINPTGLVAHASNYFVINLKNGSTVMGSWSTSSSAQGALTADTFVDLVLSSTASDLILSPDSVVTLLLDLNGTQTLPAGKLVVHGKYI